MDSSLVFGPHHFLQKLTESTSWDSSKFYPARIIDTEHVKNYSSHSHITGPLSVEKLECMINNG